jgi:hypothetical protein
VLTGWRLLAPGQSTGKRLTHKIYLPLVRRGDEDLELALTYFDLVRNVKDVKTAVKDELKSAATSKRLKEAVARRLLDAEWERKSLFGLGPTVDKD